GGRRRQDRQRAAPLRESVSVGADDRAAIPGSRGPHRVLRGTHRSVTRSGYPEPDGLASVVRLLAPPVTRRDTGRVFAEVAPSHDPAGGRWVRAHVVALRAPPVVI